MQKTKKNSIKTFSSLYENLRKFAGENNYKIFFYKIIIYINIYNRLRFNVIDYTYITLYTYN